LSAKTFLEIFLEFLEVSTLFREFKTNFYIF
jgi:hypothetical protein